MYLENCLVTTRIALCALAALSVFPHLTTAQAQQAAPAGGALSPSPGLDRRGELPISGRPVALAASRTGTVWLVTMTGTMYFADSIDGDWRSASVNRPDTSMSRIMGRGWQRGLGLVHGIRFFDSRRGIAWGILYSEKSREEQRQVYLTRDGGAHWAPADVGHAFELDRPWLAANGEIWLVGYYGGLDRPIVPVVFKSMDYGQTWTAMPPPTKSHMLTAIAFDGPRQGVIAAGDEFYVTRDHGQTWTAAATPLGQGRYQRDSANKRPERISQVAITHGRLMISQDGKTFTSRFDSMDWQPWSGGRLVRIEPDIGSGAICAIDSALRVLAIDTALRPTELGDASLIAPPVSLECRDGTAWVMDTEYRLYKVDAHRSEHAFPLSTESAIRGVQNAQLAGRTLWGATDHFLYSSTDSGRSWRRLPYRASTIRGFLARGEDEALVWDGHGVTAIFDRRKGETIPVTGLDGADVINAIRTDSGWIAYGGKQYEYAFRGEVARTYFAGEFAGSKDAGFVALSRDSGATWTVIDRWKQGGVAGLYVGPGGGRMLLLSYLGSLRSLATRNGNFDAKSVLTADSSNVDAVPYSERPAAIYFTDSLTGFVNGWNHWTGGKFYKTADGGKSWVRITKADFPYRSVFPFGSRYLASTDSSVYLLDGDRREQILHVDPGWLRGALAVYGVTAVANSGAVLVSIAMSDNTTTFVLVDPRTHARQVLAQ